VFVMRYIFRNDRQKVTVEERTKVSDYVPAVMLTLIVILLIAVSFYKDKPEMTNGVICMSIALITMVQDVIRRRDRDNLMGALKDIDVHTLLMLTGIFVVVQGLTETGLIDDMAAGIMRMGGSRLFLLYTLIVWASVLISAFVDNIPYVATMLPVVQAISVSMGIEPYLLYFGLLTGATLGGNLTPVGASANITAIGILRREGHEVGFREFARIGIPFTLVAVTTGYLITWFVWS